MGTIKISDVCLVEKDIYIYIYIYTKVIVNGNSEHNLWYSCDKKYKNFISFETVDAFVVAILLYAMEHQLDIICESKMSAKLYYQLVEYLIPSIASNIRKYKPISIIADITENKFNNYGAVGGSLSGGVDSFYTLLRHLDRKEKGYNITHLCFFNAGASGSNGGDEARVKFNNRINWIKDVASKLDKELILIDTNINEFLLQDFQKTCTFRTLAIPLLFQKLFSVYYFASGTSFSDFKFSEKDSADYDLLSVQCLSTENLQFYSDGGNLNRLDKVNYISKYQITYSRLNVCAREDINCSKCEKCKRTMMALYVLGKLDLYADVFNISYFSNNKTKYITTASKERNNIEWKDIYSYLLENGEINIKHHMIYFVSNLLRKVKRLL